MDQQLEQARDIWINAFFTGNYRLLAECEAENFKVIYEQTDRIEGNHTRYEKIAHAVANGVWKPQKPDVEFEAFEFNHEQTVCRILIGVVENQQYIQETWVFNQGWKIQELRFLKNHSPLLTAYF